MLAGLPILGYARETTSVPAGATFARSYQVDPSKARLSLRGITGSITVTAVDKGEIKVKAEMTPPLAKIEDTQLDNSVQIAAMNDHSGPVKFEITVPPRCVLEIKCLNGSVTVQDVVGSMTIETTDGDITLRNISSTTVTARSTSGKIFYEGDISAQGNYIFQSFNNLIDVTVPASAAFQLEGNAFNGDVNLGGFEVPNFNQGSKRLSGSHGQGGAKIHLTTLRGQIRFHKR